MTEIADAAKIDLSLDCRAVTFENPTGARGAGGSAHGGRKGAPSRVLKAGERVVLADLAGPGTIRHIWMTFPPAPPEIMRALWLDVFYDGAGEPSVSVPCVDFFGVAHGRPVAFDSALVSLHEGRGFNAYFPMPFRQRVRVELTNGSERPLPLYYQIDYTLGAVADDAGYLHAAFRRENPTTLQRDFVIAENLHGPGRFLGCNVGVRVIDTGVWYGEGEVKVYRDGDGAQPTICGTGLEDYVGTAWGMGAHAAHYAGTPLDVRDPAGSLNPDFVGFYRWHLADPIVYARELRVTIQQIGYALFAAGQDAEFAHYARRHPAAGAGWERNPRPSVLARGIAERVDDYCATAYVYCREPQPVPRLDLAAALADIARRPYEQPHPFEAMFAGG
ncbi:MAG: DUF2961 domain-containing protein [Deltaproteobacteria bacterium]|nr:DUF2961 domain-containing protein [Deltaproteobacteria bacterium]MBI3386957.1 DUF2961 domain-containing protein [Deltaproteobacteria bacterium]